MPFHTRVFLHDTHEIIDGQPFSALWPNHKPIAEVLMLKASTPPDTFEGTYQGNPTAAGGTIFRQEWWSQGRARYHYGDTALESNVIARFLSFDTAHEKNESAAFTAYVVGDLLRDYKLLIRRVGRKRLTHPELVEEAQRVIPRWRKDGKLKGIIIEDKDSGTMLLQSLAATAEPEIVDMLVAYNPRVDKTARAGMASVHCQNGMVLLPHPDMAVDWLFDFEEEIFAFPGTPFKDQVDAFAQLIIYLEHYLSEGFRSGHSITTHSEGG